MNIIDAKVQIKNAMISYFTKDSKGNYIIPIEKQRPIFLMGPPGIGKTAIMEQIASEMGVGILSYSMTHHTRQSAIGLPYIERKKYDGVEYNISEYTMSEIIASIYDLIEESGVKEGILFLDEINCVSETLAPIMLQFLQYKIFGRHRIPKGWIIVTAGNPPEYNSSVRDFDIATWDRLKRIDIEPDFDAWKEYAYQKDIHPAIISFLESKKSDFYKIESTVDGKQFVTARGWDDLSQMIKLYELNDIIVDDKLVCQYLQNSKIARDFSIYYDLFKKYKSEYQIEKILEGSYPEKLVKKIQQSKFDERFAVVSLLLEIINDEIEKSLEEYYFLAELVGIIKTIQEKEKKDKGNIQNSISSIIDEKNKELSSWEKAGSLSSEKQNRIKSIIEFLERQGNSLKSIKDDFDSSVKSQSERALERSKHLSNIFVFLEKAFGNGQEIVLFMTELLKNKSIINFVNLYGCKEFFKYNRELMISDRQNELEDKINKLNIE